MFCTKCGREIPDGSKFCKFCGNKTLTPANQNSVPRSAETLELQRGGKNEAQTLQENNESSNSTLPVIIGIVTIVIICAVGGFFYNSNNQKQEADKLASMNKAKQSQNQQRQNSSNQNSSNKKCVITGENVYMRSGPGKGYDTLGYFEDGESVTVQEEKEGWHRVIRTNGQQCWVWGTYIIQATSAPNKGVVTGSQVYMRSGPGKDYDTIGYFNNGETVSVVRESDGWYEVKRYNGQRCWISGQYCEVN